ncbi:hypothetical protein B379_13755 [Anoxybacillus ayderensis G10]|nr:hypothetical protein B379_13755 [Anoxybacillus ayderensis G10]KHF30788.1 hypothetical protein LR68_00739 [Anoxybacillus sp. BCO1]
MYNKSYDMSKVEAEISNYEHHLKTLLKSKEKLNIVRTSFEKQIQEIDVRYEHMQKYNELKVTEPCPFCKQPLAREYLSLLNENNLSKKMLLARKDQLEQKERELTGQLAELELEIERLQVEIQKRKGLIDQHKMIENQQTLQKNLQQKKSEIVESIQKRELLIKNIKSEIKLAKNQLAHVFESIQDTINEKLTNTKIVLFKQLKNGELRPDFQILYNDKPYRILSYSEKMRCMIEISSIFRHFTNVTYPIFIDNLESITHLNPPATQIFTASVKKMAPLQLYSK